MADINTDGDLNSDGVVNLYDFNILKADFGNGAVEAASPAPSASPRPDADLLAGAAIDAALDETNSTRSLAAEEE